MSQNSRIDLDKKVYSKTEYPRIIDTKFSQLGVKSINTAIIETPTVNEFFEMYTTLFYEIPAFGDNNSHEYLITTSTEYIGFEANNEEIEALRSEITQLRKDLLQAQISNAEALTGEKLDIDLDTIDEARISDSSQFTELLDSIGQPSSPTDANTTNTTVVSNNPVNANSTSNTPSPSGGGGGGY